MPKPTAMFTKLVPALLPAVIVVVGACTASARDLAASSDVAAPGAVAGATSPLEQTPRGSRVGGDPDAAIEIVAGEWRFGRMRIEAPLPEGYPAPTPPGAIELKAYPSVRRAEYLGRGDTQIGMNLGFWPLFQHIKRRDIAMTSPVEMDYHGWRDPSGDAVPGRPTEWTMSFLYRSSDLGPAGTDGRIRIVDTEPVTVLAIGLRGPYRLDRIASGLDELERWIAAQPDDEDRWAIDGPPRAFYYNGPEVRSAEKWSEAQIPVRRVRQGDGGEPRGVSNEPGALRTESAESATLSEAGRLPGDGA
ncbi:MAG TPA: heme-binding protein [Phycisphaerales bacterium]|nr:heme-binding protein [Phycisphaerales bacterium]HMP37385.1 heme-binding protein [Phycisphaerales bacterium]